MYMKIGEWVHVSTIYIYKLESGCQGPTSPRFSMEGLTYGDFIHISQVFTLDWCYKYIYIY